MRRAWFLCVYSVVPLVILCAFTACGSNSEYETTEEIAVQQTTKVPGIGPGERYPAVGDHSGDPELREMLIRRPMGFIANRLDMIHGGAHDEIRVQYGNDGIVYDEFGNPLLRMDQELWENAISAVRRYPHEHGRPFGIRQAYARDDPDRIPTCSYQIEPVDDFVALFVVIDRYNRDGFPIFD